MTLLTALLLPVAVLLVALAQLVGVPGVPSASAVGGRAGWAMAIVAAILSGVDIVLVLASHT